MKTKKKEGVTSRIWCMVGCTLLYTVTCLFKARTTLKLYFVQEKNEFRIWRVGVDGEGRTLVCRGRGSEPFSLAVTSEHIYWSDWASHALYRIQKNGNCR
jgi:hypothetical protein